MSLKALAAARKNDMDATKRAFLPAAMELETTPSSPLGRGMLWTIVSLFVLAVLWATLGKVDVVAIANGSIIPSGKARTVQPAALGIVAGIHVENGGRVTLGQPLVTLDDTHTKAEVNRLQASIRKREDRVQRLERFRQAVQVAVLDDGHDQGATTQTQRLTGYTSDPLLAMQLRSLQAADRGLQDQKQAREGELAYAVAVVDRLRRVLPLMQERTAAVFAMQADSLAPWVQWLELEQEVQEITGQLQAEGHRVQQLKSQIRELASRRDQLYLEAIRDALLEQAQLSSELDELRQELIKAEEHSRQQVLRAPVTGIIHELRLNTVGAVVQTAEPLVDIVPEGEDLMVEAWVENRDIGFVREGQAASIKIHTFQFTKYGTVPAQLVRLSRDAVMDEQAGPRYLARFQLERDWISIEGKAVKLEPGMLASAEVSTGQRRLIEFFAAPIFSALDEAGRER